MNTIIDNKEELACCTYTSTPRCGNCINWEGDCLLGNCRLESDILEDENPILWHCDDFCSFFEQRQSRMVR